MKFVSDKTVGMHADRYQVLQEKIEKKRAEIRALELEAKQLADFLAKQGRNKSFECNGRLYRKIVQITNHQRMILDQEQCKKLLKSRTPYKPTDVRTVKVDYVYED
jgi:hypothetical protein